MGALVRVDSKPSLFRRVGTWVRSAMSDFGPFKTDAGWSMVSGQSPTDYERTGLNLRIMGFEGNPVASACIRLVSESGAMVPWEIYREQGEEKIVELNSPALTPLNRPRVGWSRYRLSLHTWAHYISYGNAFWKLHRRGGKTGIPIGIQVIPPERVDYVYLDRDTQEPLWYEWTDRNGIRQRDSYADIIHFKDLTLTDSVFGFPRAGATLLDIATDGEASKYVRQVLGNDGSPRLIIGLKAITTEPLARATEERFHERSVEQGGRGRVRFMPGVEVVEQIGFNLRELEFPSLRQVTREDICAAFGVDPRMISVASAKGNEGGLSGQQYAEARRRLYQQTLFPIMTAQESELDTSYCPEFGTVKARFSPSVLADITEDETETSTRLLAQLSGGGITREEFRKDVGRPEKMDPKHTLVGTLARIEYPVALQFVHAEPAPADPNAPPPAPGAPAPADPAPRAIVRSRVIKRGTVLSDAQRESLWQLFDQRATREELAYKRQALLLFAMERDGVRAKFMHFADQSTVPASHQRAEGAPHPDDPLIQAALQAITNAYGADGDYHRAWLERYRGLISQTFAVAGADITAGAGVSFTLENPRLQSAIQSRAQRLADHVTRTTADQITAAVSAGRDAGMPMRDIADLIDSTVFEGQAESRSLRIARTETIGAMNQGEHEAAKATGVIRSKAWLTQRDGSVRETHVACGAQGFIPMEATYSNGLQYPGDQNGTAEEVINCRCSQLYSDEEAAA